MFNLYNSIRYRKNGVISGLVGFGFRLFVGLMLVYVGIDLVSDIVRSDSSANNQKLKSMVHRYDAIDIASSVISDVSQSIEDGFNSGNEIQTPSEMNSRTKVAANSLSAKFKVQMPKVHALVDDVLSSTIGSFQDAIREGTKAR